MNYQAKPPLKRYRYMTKVNISYHRDDRELGKCEIELPNEMVDELQEKFQRLFSEELKSATFRSNGSNTIISFLASRKKIKLLEQIMMTVTDMTARLN